jgi:2-oxoglutarate dehydrogenase E2 component (dihydrolipoamide succinyltransferase)
MAKVELIMPKMGESITEATVIRWLKEVGDTIEVDEAVLEIATDKVDSEVPASIEGVLAEKLFEDGDVVQVGAPVAIISTDGEAVSAAPVVETIAAPVQKAVAAPSPVVAAAVEAPVSVSPSNGTSARFYSPLVMNIARTENIGMAELDAVPGTGREGRVTKKDILSYLNNRGAAPAVASSPTAQVVKSPAVAAVKGPAVSTSGGDQMVEMDRVRKLISKHMIASRDTSVHVTSYVEADVTNLVNWRNKIKNSFLEQNGEKLTFTPIFIEVITQALKEFPMINTSLDGDNIVMRKDISIGMATALPNGNLIVPVIKNSDTKNLLGLAKDVNSLANKARNNKLSPDDIQGGTYTITNVGTFGNLMGTAIINQPQVGIMATGAIKKKPAVVETPQGDFIAIRHLMFLSHTYDHRIVDGALGGSFVRRVADLLENWDVNRSI